VPTLPRPSTRFDRLPAWQRAAVLPLTVLVICFVLLLCAEAAVRVRTIRRSNAARRSGRARDRQDQIDLSDRPI
jgi:hypothetical protein